MKKVTIYIILLVISCLLAMYALKSISENHANNAFTRNFTHSKIQFKNMIELPNKQFVFAGKLDTNISLNIYSDRLNLYKIDYSLKKLDTIVIKYPSSFKADAKNIYKDFQYPNIYTSNPYGDISIFNGQVAIPYKINGFRFDFFQAISHSAIIVRARYNYKEQKNRSLAKLILSKKVSIKKQYPLPELINGFFTNDGMLLYDKENSRILYMYFYRGEYISLDTNLNLLYTKKTIDTVQAAKIKTSIINTRKQDNKILKQIITQTTPPQFINTYITTNNHKVYILSKLKADNETQSGFTDNNVIDVYDIRNGKYIHSFYIPKYKGRKLNQFQIKKDIMVTIYGSFLVIYNFAE